MRTDSRSVVRPSCCFGSVAFLTFILLSTAARLSSNGALRAPSFLVARESGPGESPPLHSFGCKADSWRCILLLASPMLSNLRFPSLLREATFQVQTIILLYYLVTARWGGSVRPNSTRRSSATVRVPARASRPPSSSVRAAAPAVRRQWQCSAATVRAAVRAAASRPPSSSVRAPSSALAAASRPPSSSVRADSTTAMALLRSSPTSD